MGARNRLASLDCPLYWASRLLRLRGFCLGLCLGVC
jgi:hypothetical protein